MTATTRPAGDLPFLVRMAFFWNCFGPRARGYVPRQVGRLYSANADYFIETAHGAKLRIDMRNLDVYAPIFNASGRWEPHVANTYARMLRPHEVFFDIGANAGIVTLEVSAILGGSCRSAHLSRSRLLPRAFAGRSSQMAFRALACSNVASNVLAESPVHRDRLTDDWFA